MKGIWKIGIVQIPRSRISEIPMDAVGGRPDIGREMNGIVLTLTCSFDIGFVPLKELGKTITMIITFQGKSILLVIARSSLSGWIVNYI